MDLFLKILLTFFVLLFAVIFIYTPQPFFISAIADKCILLLIGVGEGLFLKSFWSIK